MHMGQLIYLGVSFLVAKGAFPNICYKNGVLIGEGGAPLDEMISEVSDLLCATLKKTIDDRQCDL